MGMQHVLFLWLMFFFFFFCSLFFVKLEDFKLNLLVDMDIFIKEYNVEADYLDCYPHLEIMAQGYKTFFMLSSAETIIYPAHKCWHFNIYKQDKLKAFNFKILGLCWYL